MMERMKDGIMDGMKYGGIYGGMLESGETESRSYSS